MNFSFVEKEFVCGGVCVGVVSTGASSLAELESSQAHRNADAATKVIASVSFVNFIVISLVKKHTLG